MGVTNYHTINGRIVGQTKNGVRTHYVPDALGSVVATLDANGTVENTYRYKPYGNLLAKTGTGDDPRFMWVGSRGYRRMQADFALIYVRARTYLPTRALWTTRDDLWLSGELPYSYVSGNPVTHFDDSGQGIVSAGGCRADDCVDGMPVPRPYDPFKTPILNACKKITDCFNNPNCKQRALNCMGEYISNPLQMFKCLYERCNSSSYNTTVRCDGFHCWRQICAYTEPGNHCVIHICTNGLQYTCGCTVAAIFVPRCKQEFGLPVEITVIHELTHCCGMPKDPDFGDEVAGCIW